MQAKAIIHVNRQFIAMNAKDGKNRPVFTVKMRGKTRYGHTVHISGPSRLVHPGTQLKCGARAWIECCADDVTIENEMTFKEAKAYT